MKKAIALHKSDTEVARLLDAIFESKQRFHQKLTFINKQAETAKAEWQAENEPLWKELRERLKTVGMLPDEYKDGDTLSYDRDGGVLFWIKDEPDPLSRFLADFFGAPQ